MIMGLIHHILNEKCERRSACPCAFMSLLLMNQYHATYRVRPAWYPSFISTSHLNRILKQRLSDQDNMQTVPPSGFDLWL